VITIHKEIVEHRVVQLDNKIGALCSTNYTTTTVDGVKIATPNPGVDLRLIRNQLTDFLAYLNDAVWFRKKSAPTGKSSFSTGALADVTIILRAANGCEYSGRA
jgi:hypothetical protein